MTQFFARIEIDPTSANQGFCTLETQINDIDLPVFSDVQNEYHTFSKFSNPHNVKIEVAEMIKEVDQAKQGEKIYEVDHFYIDFTLMIIGEKIKYVKYRKPNERYVLNDLVLADLMMIEDDNMQFYMQETVQQIIDYHWVASKRLMMLLFYMYLVFFVLPFMTILLNKDTLSHEWHILLFKVCCFPQYVLFAIELTQMWKQGFEYF